jgi:hypothetical protein
MAGPGVGVVGGAGWWVVRDGGGVVWWVRGVVGVCEEVSGWRRGRLRRGRLLGWWTGRTGRAGRLCLLRLCG